MAIYVVHRYGERFYGPEPDLPTFDVTSFKAYSVDYQTMHVTWNSPTGEFDRFRLVKGIFGFPANENDGQILIDSDVADTGYDDTDLGAARFVYYSIFLRINGVWLLASTCSALHIRNKHSDRWLWDRLPIHYQMLRSNQLTLEADYNYDLARYMAVIGWGVDRIRTATEAATYRADVYYSHIGIVELIADQLGLPRYGGLPGIRQRSLTANATPLLAERGATETAQAAGRIISGWDVVLRPTRNRMLSTDRAAMINPKPLEWDPAVYYPVGSRVTFFDAAYVCVTAALGYEQCPEGERVSNTWWQALLAVDDRTVAWDSAAQAQHTWHPLSLTGGVGNDKVLTKMILGAPRPLDSLHSTNGVILHNNHSSAITVAARCVPTNPAVATTDPLAAIQNGVPLPVLYDWSPTRRYDAGDLVSFQGRCYHAIRPSKLGVNPRDNSDRWQVVGTDNRIKVTLSAYTHQPHTNSGKPVDAATVFIDWYDDRGVLIGREFGNPTDTRVLDTFTTYSGSATSAITSRTTEYGAKTWSSPVGSLVRDSYQYGVVKPNAGDTRSMSVINYGSANATVASTFVAVPDGGKQQAIILRQSSSTSYVRATRTKLQTVSGATVTDLVTYGTPIGDGDRLTVTVTGNNYTILRNGTQVGTATSSFNSSATNFGLAVEA
ncbi:hypothetical protein FDA94_29155 [Herbidospora galbida]|uniref:Uncharacterized protein n=1 Tax=Herbidospora galbida TaxID=2575442 RepID=A0A4U3M9E4_9ACTN|nr:hypothetical protein [Herbidospora galbida]TKK84684.1 hypothetical protein FDA94_29155 [Herbidospora galbida]